MKLINSFEGNCVQASGAQTRSRKEIALAAVNRLQILLSDDLLGGDKRRCDASHQRLRLFQPFNDAYLLARPSWISQRCRYF